MKTAALFLRLLFVVLVLSTLAVLASEIAKALRPAPLPITQHSSAAPSVYSYVQPAAR